MAETSVAVTPGSGANIDGFALPDGKVQQAVTLGDGATNGRIARVSSGGQLGVNGGGVVTGVGTLTAAGTTSADLVTNSSRYTIAVAEGGNLTVGLTGTLVGTVVFEASMDGAGVAWFPIQGQPSDGGPVVSTVVAASGNLLMFDFAATGITHLRVRCSAFTSGIGTIYSAWGGLINDPIVSQIPLQAVAGVGTSVTASTASQQLLAVNRLRRGYVIFNDSAAVLSVALGFTPVAAGVRTYDIQPGGLLDMPVSNFVGQINGLWASATGAARITELT